MGIAHLAPGPDMPGYRHMTIAAASTLSGVMGQRDRRISMARLARELGVDA